jgi:hypothetical protein
MPSPALTLVSSAPDSGRRSGTPRPITAYYFTSGRRSPIRISRSTTAVAATCAVLRRLDQGEPIRVVEVVDQHGRLLRTITVRYGKVSIDL